MTLAVALTAASPSAAAEPAENNAVACVGRCISFLDPGSYRVIVGQQGTIERGFVAQVLPQPVPAVDFRQHRAGVERIDDQFLVRV